jgi:hypothetical protein
LTDEPVIAHAIFPELCKPRAVQRLSDATWIVQPGYSVMKELQDALGLLSVEFAQFSINLGRELNVVGHDVSWRSSAGWSTAPPDFGMLPRGGTFLRRAPFNTSVAF